MNAEPISVVTGGMGFIGHHLVRDLKRRGHTVRVIDNLANGFFKEREVEGVLYYSSDITSDETRVMSTIFKDATYVFHLAALPRVQFSLEHPAETEAVNVGGTIKMLEEARKAGVKKFVFASSSSVYGEPERLPVHEGFPLNPMSPYAKQKETSEWYCKLYAEVHKLSTVSLRFFNVYGSGADPNGAYALVVAKFIAQRLRQEPMTIRGNGSQTRDFTHVSDIVRGMLMAAEHPKVGEGDVINLGGGKQVSVNKVAELIGGPTINIAPVLEPHDTLADISHARRILDWVPLIPFKQGIAELKALHGLD